MQRCLKTSWKRLTSSSTGCKQTTRPFDSKSMWWGKSRGTFLEWMLTILRRSRSPTTRLKNLMAQLTKVKEFQRKLTIKFLPLKRNTKQKSSRSSARLKIYKISLKRKTTRSSIRTKLEEQTLLWPIQAMHWPANLQTPLRSWRRDSRSGRQRTRKRISWWTCTCVT